jgi:predicted CxxxxCH...CXXCH cytochrome family protein
MSTKSREVLFGSRVRLREMKAEAAREKSDEALREADRAECLAWSLRMEGFGGPAQPSPTIAQCLNGGLGWLEVKCHRCGTQASIPLDAIRRPRDTPLWKLEASFGCRSCRTARYKPRAYMVKLTEAREITPSPWHHPENEDGH